ncbi:MAG: hypothetical protein LQ342_001836 [Letrouitia transgressa]|nr:MAG: hypothetical protein LQ342_001836 [Letrouitia transgressa]
MRAQYQNVHHQAHATPPRRPGIAPIVPNAQAQAQAQARERHLQMQKDKYDHQLARRRANKPTDKHMPDGVEDLIIGDGVQQYKRLREVEKKLDSVMMRKRLDMQDARQSTSKKYKTLRIWISNTVENQGWQGNSLDEDAFDFHTGPDGTYRMKIEGRLLEEDDGDSSDKDSDEEYDESLGGTAPNGDAMDHDGQTPKKTPRSPAFPQRTKLSHFFRRIVIDFDRSKSSQPENLAPIEWEKPDVPRNSTVLPAAADFDCLEFERKSDENINCTINFSRDDQPQRFLLSDALADILDSKEEDRESIILGIWEYAKAMGLQQDEEKRLVQCDDRLRKLFNRESFYFPDLIPQAFLVEHLEAVPPISIPYTIRVDPAYHSQPNPPPTVYDISIPIASHSHPPPMPNPQHLQVLSQLDSRLALLIQGTQQSKAKHAFLTEMSVDPVGFLKRWMGSQRRDLEVIIGDGLGMGKGDYGIQEGVGVGPEWRRGGADGVWGKDEVKESVQLMVGKERRGH